MKERGREKSLKKWFNMLQKVQSSTIIIAIINYYESFRSFAVDAQANHSRSLLHQFCIHIYI